MKQTKENGEATVESQTAEATGPTSAASVVEEDLYCLGCGYSLRGLTGEQIRCPECGEVNPVSGEPLPVKLMARHLREMDTVPSLCVLLFLLGVPLLASNARATFGGDFDACVSGVLSLVVLGGWAGGVLSFRNQCGRQPGWKQVLALYHLLGLWIAGVLVGIWYMYAEQPLYGEYFLAPLLIILLLILATWVVLGIGGRLGPIREALCREEASRRARRELGRLMRSPHGYRSGRLR